MLVQNSKFKIQSLSGFTLLEMLVVMGIFMTIMGMASINLINIQKRTNINSSVDVLISDLKSQQIRAMVGEEDGGGNPADYGVHFETQSYTDFKSNYGTENFVTNLPNNAQFENPPSQIIFQKGSGEIGSQIIITIKDTNSSSQKAITLNKYGVITGVN